MGTNELIAALADSLAWPAAAVGMVVLLRRQLRSLLGRLTGVKGPGGVEASFQAEARKVEAVTAAVFGEEAAPVPLPRGAPSAPGGPDPAPSLTLAWEGTERIDELVRSTRADESSAGLLRVLSSAWQMVSAACQEAAVRQSLTTDDMLATRKAVGLLESRGLLKPGIAGLVDALAEMRDRAFQSAGDLDPRSVRTFVKAAGRVARAMDRVPVRTG